MLSPELIGRRVEVIAWYDYPPLVAARGGTLPLRCGPVGTVTRVDDRTDRVAVLVEGLGRVLVFPRGDVVVLPPRAIGSREESETMVIAPDTRPSPTVWVTCPPCEGTGRSGDRACFLCAGSGKLRADVAEDPDDPAEMEARPTDDG